MNKNIKNLVLFTFILIIAFIGIKSDEHYYNKESDSAMIKLAFTKAELDRFLDDVGYSESSNRYDVVSRYGYLGKYQFSMSTLRGIGYDISRKEFLSNPIIQDEAMIDLMKYNKDILQKYIDKWDGKTYKGVKITESGILAAAHLTGASSVKKYFKYGINRKDALGTSITDYMVRFNGYKIKI
jgi:hypothetical protein